jgi:Nas2 N_terminal domain
MSMSSSDTEQVSNIRELLKSLNVQREALESESEAITSELTSRDPEQPNVPAMGIDTPLVDEEGYPRNDIDIFRARTLRNRLMIVRTDHKKLMNEIDRSLQLLAIWQPESQAQQLQAQEEAEEALRRQEKPKPKYDPVSGKWVVRNWDGSIAGIPTNDTTLSLLRSFDEIPNDLVVVPSPVPRGNVPIPVPHVATTDTPVVSPSTTATNHTLPSSSSSVTTTTAAKPMIHRAAVSIQHHHQQQHNGVTTTTTTTVPPNATPWARVDSVAALDSPAALAGVQVEDRWVAFGPLVTMDAVAMAALVETAAARNEIIQVLCQRREHSVGDDSGDRVEWLLLSLSPRAWAGRGLLGCHIVPC